MADDDEFEVAAVTASPSETMCITVPGEGASRGAKIKGCVLFSWQTTVEQATALEENLKRHNPATRIRVRLYRGERELKPILGDDNDLSLPVPSPPVDQESATLRLHINESARHLEQIRKSIDQEQLRLADMRAELATLRDRRDKEILAMSALVHTIQDRTAEDVKAARSHASAEMVRAQQLDAQVGMQLTTTWAQLASNANNLNTVRGMLAQGLLADRTEKYLNIASAGVKGFTESQVGRLLGLRLAAALSEAVNKKLQPDQQGTTPEDAIAGAVVFGAGFNGRRQILREFATRHGGREGQALVLGLDYCFGDATPDALKAYLGLEAAPSTG